MLGLVYSTYLGGSGVDGGDGIALDTIGNAYAVGVTDSPNFPTTAGAFQTAPGGGDDGFVAKLNPTGSGLVYSTYLRGSGTDTSQVVGVDTIGNAYIAGRTDSGNFPPASPFEAVSAGGFDAFVAKMHQQWSSMYFHGKCDGQW